MIRQVALQRLSAAYQGRAREESYLELAQEHFLDWMREQGLLDEVIVKGGTSFNGVAFLGFDIDKPAMKGTWTAEAPGLGATRLVCRLDFSTRPLMLPSIFRHRAELPSVNQKELGFAPVDVRIADSVKPAPRS